jgi:alpha-beta hydrolase superfamily lysophospholipase
MTKVKTHDGVELSTNKYIVENMKAVVICVHGMCEHSLRYEEFALFLNQKGFSVITYDSRGHGNSLLKGEDKGYQGKDGFNKMVLDLNRIVLDTKAKIPNHKIYILGHSMGSFVLERYIQLYDEVDGVIISGSNFGTKFVKIGRFISKLVCLIRGKKRPGKLIEKLSFGNYNTAFKPNRTKFDWLSRDESSVDKYLADDFCGFTCSNQFYYDFLRGLIELSKKRNMSLIKAKLPILIISGAKDPVGYQGEGVKRLYQVLKKSVAKVDLKLYPDGRHEMLNELNKTEVFSDIYNWLTIQLEEIN